MAPKHSPLSLHTTKLQRDNLLKLAAYLEVLPADYDKFSMHTFMLTRTVEGEPVHITSPGVPPCETVRCAVGHGPAAGIAPDEHDYDWLHYAFSKFGNNVYEWCFTGAWTQLDNTPIGVARRIRHMFHHGLPLVGVAGLVQYHDEWYNKEILGGA